VGIETLMGDALRKEMETFNAEKDRLLGTSEGKFVLIHGDEVVGVYESKNDAIAQGYQQFGNVPFLVKQILRIDPPEEFVSNLVGV